MAQAPYGGMLRSRVLVSTQTLSSAPPIECRLLTILFCFRHFPSPQNYIPALNFQDLNPNITLIVHCIYFLYLEMIQNFSHKHALLIAQCVCRNSPPGKRSSLFYPPYPHRHKFSTEANFRGSYFYLLDID